LTADIQSSGTPTRADALHARLRSRLLDGAYAPGEQVSIRQIADAEGTSMIPARDALRGLVTEGALEFRGARAIAVPAPTAEALDQISYARVSLEGELAARAAPVLFGECALLDTLDADVDAAITNQDALAYMSANRRFHFTIYGRANAPVLLAHAELLWLRIGPSMRLICEDMAGHLPAIDQHRTAVAALRNRDGKAFRAAIEADIAMGMAAITGFARATRRTSTERPN